MASPIGSTYFSGKADKPTNSVAEVTYITANRNGQGKFVDTRIESGQNTYLHL